MCIICFLKDNYQYSLRKNAMFRSDRIEHTIDRYKYLFVDNFKNSLHSFCELHNNETNFEINNILAEIEIGNVINFFNVLRNVYITWIDAQIGPSIERLQSLLKDYRILGDKNIIQSDIFFRGRISTNFISHWDMFHIPFNKRYLIQNQRYSLTGQPILYLSSSPHTVIRELGTPVDVRISTFRLDSAVSFNVYENINKFNDVIVEGDSLSPKASADFMVNSNLIGESYSIVSYFYKMILASCCSFERRDDTRNSSFSEEYVLPQVLTLVLKQNNYDGVKYTSTKAYTDSDITKHTRLINILYSNICLFTNYTEEQSIDIKNVYDRQLYNKFILSAPIKYNEIIPEGFYLIDDTLKLIDEAILNGNANPYEEEIMASIGNKLMDLSDFLKKSCKDDSCRTKELYKSINLQCFLLKDIILNIKENEYKNLEGGFINE